MAKKILRILYNFPQIACSFLLSVIIALNLFCVVMRYFVGNPITWGEEVTLGMYVWMVMLGAAYVVQKNAGIKLDFLMQKLPSLPRKIQLVFVAVVTLFFFVILSYFTFRLMGVTRNLTGIFKIHYKYIYVSIIVGAVYIVVYLVQALVNIVKGKPLDLTYSAEEAAEMEAVMANVFDDVPLFGETETAPGNGAASGKGGAL